MRTQAGILSVDALWQSWCVAFLVAQPYPVDPARRGARACVAALALGGVGSASEVARASDAPVGPSKDAVDYTTPRYEPAGFPILGGDTDIGFEAGVAGSLARFANDVRPYAWNLNVRLSASFKNDNGFGVVQQSYFAALDVPKVAGSNVRLMPAVGFVRTINAPYFGVGNANTSVVPEGVADASQYHQYLSETFFVRTLARIMVHKPYEIVLAPLVRYIAPTDYSGSLLASDAQAGGTNGRPVIHGLHDETLATFAAGLIVDSRDNETFPRSGVYHQMGVRYVQGFPFGEVAYAGVSGVFSGFLPMGEPFSCSPCAASRRPRFRRRSLLRPLHGGTLPFPRSCRAGAPACGACRSASTRGW